MISYICMDQFTHFNRRKRNARVSFGIARLEKDTDISQVGGCSEMGSYSDKLKEVITVPWETASLRDKRHPKPKVAESYVWHKEKHN